MQEGDKNERWENHRIPQCLIITLLLKRGTGIYIIVVAVVSEIWEYIIVFWEELLGR